MTLLQIARYLWASPTTAVALPLLLATLLTGGGLRLVDGVLEIHGGASAWYLRRVVGLVLRGGASAMTLGHIVLARDRASHDLSRAHERVHVRQCECWGPLFLPAYIGVSILLWLSGRHPYRDNPFEKEAYKTAR